MGACNAKQDVGVPGQPPQNYNNNNNHQVNQPANNTQNNVQFQQQPIGNHRPIAHNNPGVEERKDGERNQMPICNLDTNIKCIAAIDLGTSRSAHAYTTVGNQGNVVMLAPRNSVIKEDVDIKAETAVLFDRKTKKVVGFGTKGKETYFQNQENYYLFSRFKMKIEELSTSDSVDQFPDYMNHEMELRTIVTESIRYLSDSILEIINRQNLNEPLTKKDIHWVLTIPCIFDEAPQGFMRNCALAAGIIDYQLNPRLTLVRESEAASIDLLHRIEQKSIRDVALVEGTDIAILDCGGGTADMSFLRVMSQKPFIYDQLKAPTGNKAGATLIDAELTGLFYALFGEKCVEHMRIQSDYVTLMDTWETSKRQYDGSPNFTCVIDFSTVADDELTGDRIATAVRNYNANVDDPSLHLTSQRYRVTIPSALIRKWFDPLLKKIGDDMLFHLNDTACANISLIYMVGGFSGNPYLKNYIQNYMSTYRPGVRVLVPDQPDVSIVRGAVLTASQNRINKFKMAKTYGIETIQFYNKNIHDITKAYKLEGNYNVRLFHPFVTKGDEVEAHFVTPPQIFVPSYKGMSDLWVHLYALDDKPKHVTYISDAGLELVTKVQIPIDKNIDWENQVFTLSLEIGNEIKIHVNRMIDDVAHPVKDTRAEYMAKARLPPAMPK